MKEARKIANDEPVVLETPQSYKPLSVNQQEINNAKEEIEDEKYWHDNFSKKYAKIKIQNTPRESRIDQRKVEEIKCPGCFKKSYGAKSHNDHMNNCITNILKIFFGEFQLTYKARFEKKITQEEYLISAISLIINYTKKIKNIAKKQDIDIDAISKILPEIPNMQDFMPPPVVKSNSGTKNNYYNSNNNNNNSNSASKNDRFSSPATDNGYYSNTQ